MNETIKQLCELSKVYANESTKDFTGNEPVVWMDYYTEKFAELIVRECIKVIETNHPEFDCKESADNLIRRAGRMDAMDEISNHFEVEL